MTSVVVDSSPVAGGGNGVVIGIRKGSYEDELKNNSSSESRDEVGSGGGSVGGGGVTYLPTEGQLVLLCLDYLRDLRRAYDSCDLAEAEGINPDYLSIAIYALSRCFTHPEFVTHEYRGNDAHKRPTPNTTTTNINNNQETTDNGESSATANSGTGSTASNSGNSSVLSVLLPMMDVINNDILYSSNPFLDSADADGEQKKEPDEDDENPYSWYEYDDYHPSNAFRFFPLNGLASGPNLRGPLTLGELTVSGLANLGARSRIDAERDMVKSPLFDQFVMAVKAKNFFCDPDNDTPQQDPHEEKLRLQRQQQVYEERYRKVVAKFRNKLATKAEASNATQSSNHYNNSTQNNNYHGKPPTAPPTNNNNTSHNQQNTNSTAYLLSLTAADRQRKRRQINMQDARYKKEGDNADADNDYNQYNNNNNNNSSNQTQRLPPRGATGIIKPNTYYHPHEQQQQQQQQQMSGAVSSSPENNNKVGSIDTSHDGGSVTGSSPQSPLSQDNPMDIEEAERLKSEGNGFMQRKEYQSAINSYTHALKLSPTGPNSHVYFSNRAAALLSIKRFPDAILDSERALALRPDYGKAHARLGLAHFLMGSYRKAMEAYTVSLKYDPDNKSSQNYLEKAAKRLAASDPNNNSSSNSNNNAMMSSGASTSGMSAHYHNDNISSNHSVTGGSARGGGGGGFDNPGVISSSFSLVSEWDKSNNNNNNNNNNTPGTKGNPITVASSTGSYGGGGAKNNNNNNNNNVQVVAGTSPGGNHKSNQQDNNNEQGVESILSPSSLTASTAVNTPTSEDKQKRLLDQREAEKYKAKGNSFMAAREYKLALEAYSNAISLSSNGPHSHVYFSNRAAALCYLEKYKEAEADSESSLRLNPTYGKAHARLGLSRFFLKDYKGAVQAYTSALEYDPDNAASKSYLAKAVSKLESQKNQNQANNNNNSSRGHRRTTSPSSPARGGYNNGSQIPPPSATTPTATQQGAGGGGEGGGPVPEFLNMARKMAQTRRV